MRNVLLKIRFDGTSYHGFQVQKNAVSVQSVLQQAIEKTFNHKTLVTGCSRTDAGVHALGYCALTQIESEIPCEKIPVALNRALPYDVSVIAAKDVDESFHPRYSAHTKTYVYNVLLSQIRDPFLEKYSYRYALPIDITKVSAAAEHIVGKHNFSAFMASGSKITDTVRTVCECSVCERDNMLTITVSADGFLYNMVRIIVGTLLDVGSGKIKLEDMEKITAGAQRNAAGFTAPPQGLFLSKVDYGKEFDF